MDYKSFISKALENKDVNILNKYKNLTDNMAKYNKLNKKYLLENNIKLVNQNGGVLVKVLGSDKSLIGDYQVIQPFDPNIIIRIIGSEYYISLETPFTINRKQYDVLLLQSDIKKVVNIINNKLDSLNTFSGSLLDIGQIQFQIHKDISRTIGPIIKGIHKDKCIPIKEKWDIFIKEIRQIYQFSKCKNTNRYIQYIQTDNLLFLLLFYIKNININNKNNILTKENIIIIIININIFYFFFEIRKIKNINNQEGGGGLFNTSAKYHLENNNVYNQNYSFLYLLYYIFFNIFFMINDEYNENKDIELINTDSIKFLENLKKLDYYEILKLFDKSFNYLKKNVTKVLNNKSKQQITQNPNEDQIKLGVYTNFLKKIVNNKLKYLILNSFK